MTTQNNTFTDGNFYLVPKGVHLIVKRATDLCVLTCLLQCRNGVNTCFPSYQPISQGLMSRRQAMLSVQRLDKLGVISIRQTQYKANTCKIHLDVIERLTSGMASLVKSFHPEQY